MTVWESRYRTLFDSSLTGNYVATPDGNLLLVNRCLAQLLGYESTEALLNQKLASLWVDQAERVHIVNRLRLQRRLEREVVRLRHRDAGTIHLTADFVGVFQIVQAGLQALARVGPEQVLDWPVSEEASLPPHRVEQLLFRHALERRR
jgi:PAS domain S-box-containing protein